MSAPGALARRAVARLVLARGAGGRRPGEERRMGFTRRGLILVVVVFGLVTMTIWPLR